MKYKYYGITFLYFLILTSCTSGGDVFLGEWIDQKNPEHTWKIEESMLGFKGEQTGENGGYDFTTETWSLEKDGNVLKLIPDNEKGTTITYLKDRDLLIRFPPGTTYKRMK